MAKKSKHETTGNGHSFFVDICCSQNGTWQGNVTWVKEQKTLPFRSALELIKLIDSTIDDGDNLETW